MDKISLRKLKFMFSPKKYLLPIFVLFNASKLEVQFIYLSIYLFIDFFINFIVNLCINLCYTDCRDLLLQDQVKFWS